MKPTTLALILAFFASCATGGKLSTKYLPPNFAGSSSGSTGLRTAPRPSNQYLTPHYHGVNAGAVHKTNHKGNFAAASQYSHNKAAAQIPIIRNNYVNDGSGNYNFDFETGNGIRRDETGVFKGGWPQGSQSVSGSYSYTGDDGHVYTVNYKADGNGFHAEGDHLPTPPPIPQEIQQSLALHQSSFSTGHSIGGGGSQRFQQAATHHTPSSQYLPPHQEHQGYNYGRRH